MSVQKARDFPFSIDTGEFILIPAILNEFRRAVIGRFPMPGDEIDSRFRHIAVNAHREIGKHMMAPDRRQEQLGASGPEVRIDSYLGKACSSLKIDIDLIRKAPAVERPFATIYRTGQIDHDFLNLVFSPEEFDHPIMRYCRI